MRVQSINSIELSTKCNLACKYCVNRLIPKAGRKHQIMTDDVFEGSLNLLDRFMRSGTQTEINLNGIGESLLDPQIVDRVSEVRRTVKDRSILLTSNGINLSRDLAIRLKDAGISQIHISAHSPYHARQAIQILLEVGIPTWFSCGAIVSPHNFADQIGAEHSVMIHDHPVCGHLANGWGHITVEGFVTRCCLDYRLLGKVGNVFDADLDESEPFELCRTCHQVIGHKQ